MKRLFLLSFFISSFFLLGCYNPQLDDEPFVCGGSHGSGECPDGYGCYGGICLDQAPECWQDDYFNTIGGNDDRDFEPNNTPDLAYMLECGDTITNNQAACPVRYDIQRTYMNLAICGEGDIDIYKIFLQANERINIIMKYDHNVNRDLDMALFHRDSNGDYNLSTPDAKSSSTNDDEEISHTVIFEGWYYLIVYGNTINDINGYALQWQISAPATTK